MFCVVLKLGLRYRDQVSNTLFYSTVLIALSKTFALGEV